MTHFHASPDRLDVGTQLRPGPPKVTGTAAQRFEATRPAGIPERKLCNYAVDSADPDRFVKTGVGFPSGYIHVIEAEEWFGPFDMFWIGAVQIRHYATAIMTPQGRAVIDNQQHHYRAFAGLTDFEIAECYWSHQPSPNPQWEYATTTASVAGHQPDAQVTFRSEQRTIEWLLNKSRS